MRVVVSVAADEGWKRRRASGGTALLPLMRLPSTVFRHVSSATKLSVAWALKL